MRTLNFVLFLIVLGLLVAAAAMMTSSKPEPQISMVAEVETYTKLKPAIVNGQPSLPTQVWLDPGAKLDIAMLKDGVLQWSTRPMRPGEPPQTYEVLVGGGSVTFIEQACAPR